MESELIGPSETAHQFIHGRSSVFLLGRAELRFQLGDVALRVRSSSPSSRPTANWSRALPPATVETAYAPADLFNVVMTEHIRSTIELEEFNVGVLKIDQTTRGQFERWKDDFPHDDRERHAANVRRAYRDEAQPATRTGP